MSIVVAATDLEDLVRRMDKAIRQSIGPRQAVQTHVQLRKSITLPMGEGGDGEKTPMMVTLLWLALNHPHHGDERVPDRRMQ